MRTSFTFTWILLGLCLPVWAWQADLQVTLVASPESPYLDGAVTYTATVTNLGPDLATGNQLTMLLPGGTTLVSQEPLGEYNESERQIVWQVGDLNADQSADFSVNLSLPLRSSDTHVEIYTFGYDPQGESPNFYRTLPGSPDLELLQSFPTVVNPTGLVMNDSGQWLLLDQGDETLADGDTALADGRLLRIAEEGVAELSAGSLLLNPRALVAQPGRYLVVEPQGFADQTPSAGRLVAIDAVSGAQTVFAEGDLITLPQDIINDDNGAVVIVDNNSLIRVSADGAVQSLLTGGNLIQAPLGLDRDSAGFFWVADQISGILKINGDDFSQEQIKPIDAAGNTFENPFDLLVTRSDRLFVTSFAANGNPIQNLLEINPVDGSVLLAQRYDGPHLYRGLEDAYELNNDVSVSTESPDANLANNQFVLSNTVLPAAPTITIQVSEAISVSDSEQVAPALQISVQETLSVGERESVTPALWIRESETVTVTDNPQPALALQVHVTETVGVADRDVTQLALQLAVQETVTVGEQEQVQPDSGGPGVVGTFLPGLRVVPENGELLLGETQMWLQFSELLQDLPGDEEAGDVTNPIHYQLVAAGSDESLQTEVCGDVPAGDDQFVAIGRIVWLPERQTAAVVLEGASSLAAGLYRMLICGDRGLVDLENLALDGDGDQQPGGDYRFDFRVLGDNLLNNPQFDQDLSSWVATQGDGQLVFSESDGYHTATSGSVSFPASEGGIGLSQCLTWHGRPFWQLGGLVQIGPETMGEQLELRIDWFAANACDGEPLQTQQRTIASRTTDSQWIPFQWQGAVPEGAVSATVTFQWPQGSSALRYLDRLYFSADSEIRLIDDFESGTLDLWRVPAEQ